MIACSLIECGQRLIHNCIISVESKFGLSTSRVRMLKASRGAGGAALLCLDRIQIHPARWRLQENVNGSPISLRLHWQVHAWSVETLHRARPPKEAFGAGARQSKWIKSLVRGDSSSMGKRIMIDIFKQTKCLQSSHGFISNKNCERTSFLLGCRVGEAKNPGPPSHLVRIGVLNPTALRAKAHQQSQNFSVTSCACLRLVPLSKFNSRRQGKRSNTGFMRSGACRCSPLSQEPFMENLV